jgi:hypothetical protein
MTDEEGRPIRDTKLKKSCYTQDGRTYMPKPDGWDSYETYTLTKTGKPRKVKS